MADVALHALAEAEYEIALAWYRACGERVTLGFIGAVRRGIEAVGTTPDAYPRIDSNHRRYALQRYPYGLVYRVETEGVFVVALWHNRRLPIRWSSRT